jgi:hypothetical protein
MTAATNSEVALAFLVTQLSQLGMPLQANNFNAILKDGGNTANKGSSWPFVAAFNPNVGVETEIAVPLLGFFTLNSPFRTALANARWAYFVGTYANLSASTDDPRLVLSSQPDANIEQIIISGQDFSPGSSYNLVAFNKIRASLNGGRPKMYLNGHVFIITT